MPSKTDKRDRLVDAAKMLIHQQGFSLTTLADIAQAAGVPLGNVYYYFKKKEDIGEAVIDHWSDELYERFSNWDLLDSAPKRLIALVNFEVESAENISRYGCAIGGLCQELAKQGGILADSAAKLLNDILEWSEKQFRSMGYSDDARDYALQFVTRVQGMNLLVNTFRDTNLAEKIAKTTRSWLSQIASQANVETNEAIIA